VLQPGGLCSFLNEDGLCRWKKLTGEGLCAACEDFPNTYVSFLEDEYVFPSLSCEAIVELLLNKEDSIQLLAEEKRTTKTQYNAAIEKNHFRKRPLLEHYPDLTRWGLTLLQERRFSLDNRMILLAEAMCLIDWLEGNGRVRDLPQAMESFLLADSLEQSIKRYEQDPVDSEPFLAINRDIFFRYLDVPRYRTSARQVLSGLGFEIVETKGNDKAQFRLGLFECGNYLKHKEALADFMRQKEPFFEHVMICEYLRSVTPLTRPNVWDNFRFFNACYALLKGILIGSFSCPPSDSELVDSVLMLHRMFIHDYDARNQTLEHLSAIHLTDLSSMVALAKG
jgi:hypothetical protein